MKLIWISLGVLLLILAFQFKNILAHVGVELALNGFKELDRNSDGLIQKTEWPGLGFSLVDLNGDNVASKQELRELIREYARDFSWQNETNNLYDLPDQLKRGSFVSPSISEHIGYYIYIPDSYYSESQKYFRTVYYLHGGRPGNEARSVYISNYLHKIFQENPIEPALYIFVNGGALSHYNSEEKDSYGEDIFIKELMRSFFNSCSNNFMSRGKSIVNDFSCFNVFKFSPNESWTFPRFDMLKFNYKV